ncbi:MAG: branched-chain amino acid ABC transporter permease [Acetobacteraceae bacterium]
MLSLLPQLVVSGTATGMLYALIALSMTVVYRATTVVNFGHGDMVAAGAYAVFVFGLGFGLPFLPAMVLAIALLFAAGFAAQRFLLQPIVGGPHLSLAMMALAIGYTLRGGLRLQWGTETINPQRPYDMDAYMLGNVVITTDDLVICTSVLLLLAALFVLLQVTPLGKVIQATFQSQRGAALVGINVPMFHALMWGGGAALGAVGGVMLSMIAPLTPDLGQWTLIQGFAAMTLGGFGSLGGAVAGGILLGITEKLLGFYVSTVFIDVTGYLVPIVVLMLRPQGLFGRRVALRV